MANTADSFSALRSQEKERQARLFLLERSSDEKEHLISDQQYDYYAINLKRTDFHSIKEVLDECKRIEAECWNPQEDFYTYIEKIDYLYYAMREGSIRGFFLVSYFIVDGCLIISMDEIMVRSSDSGRKLALKLLITAVRDLIIAERGNQSFKTISLMSITVNPRIMNSYCKGALLTDTPLFDSTFWPTKSLINIHRKYLKMNNYKLVDEDIPFFIKAMFPGSNKLFKHGGRAYQYSEKLSSMMPDGFDPVKRGDALCFMFRCNRYLAYVTSIFYIGKLFGRGFLRSKRIGLFRSRSQHKDND
jgi:hypothetical protein